MARYYCMPLYATIPHSHFYIMLLILSPHTILYVQDHLICVLSTSSMTVWLCSLMALPCLTSPALDLPPPTFAAWTEDNYYHVSECSYTQPPFFKVGGGGMELKLPPPPPPKFLYMLNKDVHCTTYIHVLARCWISSSVTYVLVYKSKYLVF